jgi:protein-L-isoaspartate O-methyltransferase
VSDLIEEARHRYAEELRFTARLGSRAVIDAFATVPRERFFGPGPWRLLSPMALGEYWTTEDGDPRHLYHDVLIAIDEQRRLNNGQPSLWARMYEDLDLSNGAHVVHVGAGTGYYSAILAEIVGRAGRVTAIEIDAALAARARESLAAWPQATVAAADGFTFFGLARCTGGGRPPARAADECRMVGLLCDDHPARPQPGSLPREVCRPSRGNPVRRRTGPGCGGEIKSGAGERRFHRHPIAATRTPRA